MAILKTFQTLFHQVKPNFYEYFDKIFFSKRNENTAIFLQKTQHRGEHRQTKFKISVIDFGAGKKHYQLIQALKFKNLQIPPNLCKLFAYANIGYYLTNTTICI